MAMTISSPSKRRTQRRWCPARPGAIQSLTTANSITLMIRPELKFHSGYPVTVEDVAFSLQRMILLEKTPAFILSQLGWTRDNVKVLLNATDELTQLTITEDFGPTFELNCLSTGVGPVIDKKTVLKQVKDRDRGYEWMKTHSADRPPSAVRHRCSAKQQVSTAPAPGLQHCARVTPWAGLSGCVRSPVAGGRDARGSNAALRATDALLSNGLSI